MKLETRNKLRKLMKAAYAARELISFNLQLSKTPMWFAAEYMSASLASKIQQTPWQVFSMFKPEIDENRAKAWHRLQAYKRKKDIESGRVIVIKGIDANEIFTGEKMKELALMIRNPLIE